MKGLPRGLSALGLTILALVGYPSALWSQADRPWHAGTWYSGVGVGIALHNPHTIALRVEVQDSETGMAIPGAEVRLEGQFNEAVVQGGYIVGTIPRDFRLSAFTSSDGVAVFGLSWLRDSPYERIVDDIEKVRSISVRAERHGMLTQPFDLSNIASDSLAWMLLVMNTPGAKYFILKLGTGFQHYNQDSCTEQVFFQRIRDRQYDIPLPSSRIEEFPPYWAISSYRLNPQDQAGPYVMVPLLFRLQRLLDH